MHAAFELLQLPANAAPRLPRFNAAVSIILHVYVNDAAAKEWHLFHGPFAARDRGRYSPRKGVVARICTYGVWSLAPALGTGSASEAGLKLPWDQRSGTADVRGFMLDSSKKEDGLNRPGAE